MKRSNFLSEIKFYRFIEYFNDAQIFFTKYEERHLYIVIKMRKGSSWLH